MKTLIFLILLFSFKVAHAADTPDISIVNTVNEAIKLASASIMPQALIWLGSLMSIQFVVTNLHVLKSEGDLTSFWAKFLGSLMWFSFCIYVLKNGPEYIDSVGNGVLTKFAPNLPSPGSVITATLSLCSSILIGIAATGTSIAGVGNSSIGSVLVVILFTVFGAGMFMAIKLIMLQLELGLIVMMSPLSFSFLGLNALKDQGIAPFKSLISLVYRIILLGIVYSAFGKIIDVAGVQLDSFSWGNPFDWGSIIKVIFAMLCSFPVIVYLVWKSDSIAASLAGGSTNMGTADVASAAAAGAALGAAAGSGAGAVADSATKAGQTMSDFMKSLGNSGSVSDASSSGTRGFDSPVVGDAPISPKKSPQMSLQEMRNHPSSIGNNPKPESSPLTGVTQSSASPITTGSSNVRPLPGQSASPSGSGQAAGIGGAPSSTDQNMGQSNKPTFRDHLSKLNDHVAKEQATTHVSINTHHSD
ncbi:hypothetical protein FERRO_06160 [Ferrovum sp. JA12]|uniref:hypothetical protein n=1 Tax=Ferrovum sp. JA12 TaxID=1356299 RepID=UPI00070383BF|nr:hypothetical protein [Ferrovum sp. JA12]KRH79548.1 hypothetical protein FERRO_06160 [Ferrovum sp. JA12]